MKRILIFVILLLPGVIIAQEEARGAASVAMGYTGITMYNVWSTTNNQALLGSASSSGAGVYYSANTQVNEIYTAGLSFVYKLKENGSLGFMYSAYGFSQYSRHRLGFGYGLQLTDGLYAGAQLNAIILHQPSYYGNVYTVTAEAGLLYKVNDKLSFATHLYNFVRTAAILSDYEPMIFTIGAGYRFSEKAFASLEVEKNILLPVTVKWGASYELPHELSVYLGGNLQEGLYSYTFGLGYSLKSMQANLGFVLDPVLGVRAAVDLQYSF